MTCLTCGSCVTWSTMWAVLHAVIVMATQPNLVMVVIDDLGMYDTSVRVGSGAMDTTTPRSGVLTPTLQALADDGIVLSQHYVFKFCSPSRTQLLTGRYAYHMGQQSYANLNPTGKACGINASYSMLPALLAAQGYFNVALGKWHQGFADPAWTPTRRGFARFVGFYAGGESHRTHITPYSVLAYEPPWWTPANNDTLPTRGCAALWDMHNDSATGDSGNVASSADFARSVNGTHSSELTAQAFEAAVDEHNAAARDAPLFAYVAFHGVHLPLDAPESALRRYGNDAFDGDADRLRLAAMVTAVDDALARVVAKLKQAGLWDDSALLAAARRRCCRYRYCGHLFVRRL